MLEEQKNELSEQIEDDTKPLENDSSTVEASSKSDGHDETPDINDVPIDESQVIYINHFTRYWMLIKVLKIW